MITSRHNTFGCWLFILLTLFFITLSFGLIIKRYSIFEIDYFTNLDNRSFYFAISLLGASVFLFVSLISAYIKKVTIDPLNKIISFKNIVTRQMKIYDYKDFDGIIDTFLNHRSASYKTIGLIKDKKMIRYIDSFWVSNYDDLRQSLQGIKNLGTYRLGIWKQLKLLFRQPVID
jgi:hypothetical protein